MNDVSPLEEPMWIGIVIFSLFALLAIVIREQ